ncbi:stage III sporulation protein AF [Aquibacillus rhizosphaerae]|uniref:Stage III sporulation protein AF n=1 Tax=Aquibacillus rhizosphaerae TaxID=3051431 RepID=A0ABT7L6T9_9BACI|nr:stage III sporulation protein AF [Aquibacillus sp. LR5S19]MDL4841586.1 stage III sporulation protein AF [Aquibacillus sp. LR5S19]
MDWVTQIILFLLLAMVIELILPNSSMKKYIDMVVGLLLILIFLQPIFHLFQVDVQELVNKAIPELDTSFQEENMKNSIELKKNEIQASQDAYVVEEMAVQMKNQVEEGLNEQYGVGIVDITFQFNEDEESTINMENLETINIILNETEQEQEEGTVKEVVISVEDSNQKDEPKPEVEEIESYLYESWQLEDQNISILWEGGV